MVIRVRFLVVLCFQVHAEPGSMQEVGSKGIEGTIDRVKKVVCVLSIVVCRGCSEVWLGPWRGAGGLLLAGKGIASIPTPIPTI